MEKKQTAVDWLFLMINNPNDNQEMALKCLAKAKEMEMRQKIQLLEQVGSDLQKLYVPDGEDHTELDYYWEEGELRIRSKFYQRDFEKVLFADIKEKIEDQIDIIQNEIDEANGN